MITQRHPSNVTHLQPHERLTTRSLSDDEIRAIADATYRGDNPLRFESVRQAALLFERLGYSITRDPEISALKLVVQPIVVVGWWLIQSAAASNSTGAPWSSGLASSTCSASSRATPIRFSPVRSCST